MSLKDQLLKAGLVDKKKLKKAESELRRQSYDENKGKTRSILAEGPREESQILKEKRERVDALNAEINQRRLYKEKQERLYQIIDRNQIRYKKGNISYFFFDHDKKIHRLKVYPEVVRDLTFGTLGICKVFDDDADYYLVSRKIAESILDFYPEKVLTLPSLMQEYPEDYML